MMVQTRRRSQQQDAKKLTALQLLGEHLLAVDLGGRLKEPRDHHISGH